MSSSTYHNHLYNQQRSQSPSRPLPNPGSNHPTALSGLPPRRSSPVKFPPEAQFTTQPDPTLSQQKFVPHWKRGLPTSPVRTHSDTPYVHQNSSFPVRGSFIPPADNHRSTSPSRSSFIPSEHNHRSISPARSSFNPSEYTHMSTSPTRSSFTALEHNHRSASPARNPPPTVTRQRDSSPVRFYEPSPVKHDEGSLLFMTKGSSSAIATSPLPSMRARSASPQRKPLPDAPGARATSQQRPLSAFHALRSPGVNPQRSTTLPPIPDRSPSAPNRRIQPSPSWEPQPTLREEPSYQQDPRHANTTPGGSPQYGILDLPRSSPQFGIRDLPQTNTSSSPQFGIRDLPETNPVFPPAPKRSTSSMSTMSVQHSRAYSLPQAPSLPSLPPSISALGRIQPSPAGSRSRSPGPTSPLSPLPAPPVPPSMNQSVSQGAGSVTLRMARMGLNGSSSQPPQTQNSAPLPQSSHAHTQSTDGWKSGLPPLPQVPSSSSFGSAFRAAEPSPGPAGRTSSPANRVPPPRIDPQHATHPVPAPSSPSMNGFRQPIRSPLTTPRSPALLDLNYDDEPPSAFHQMSRTQDRQSNSAFSNSRPQPPTAGMRQTVSHQPLPTPPAAPNGQNPHRSNPLPSPADTSRIPRTGGGFTTPNQPTNVQYSSSQSTHSHSSPAPQQQQHSWSQNSNPSPQRGTFPVEPTAPSSQRQSYTPSAFSSRGAATPARDRQPPQASSGFRPMSTDYTSPADMQQQRRTPTPVIAAPAPQVPPIITLPDEEDEIPSIGITISVDDDDNSGPMIAVSGVDDEPSVPAPPKLRPVIARSHNPLTCGGCANIISYGRTVNAMGVRWHPDCFRCCKCETLLEHVSSYEGDSRAWCHLDYHENFAPRCYHCKTAIVEERFISLDDDALGKRAYHEHHFFCAECGDPFLDPSSTRMGALSVSGDGDFADDDVGFTVYRGHPYCEACHVRLRMPKCKKCKRSIREGMQAVEALGGKWCFECFVCKRCEKPFDNPSFFERQGDPFCEGCFSVILRNDL